jgi:tRNA G10  N-methylase Trm11
MQTGNIENRKFKFNSHLYQKIREETSNKRKGFKYSEESKRKMSESHKGKTTWNKGTKGIMIAWNKGKKMSEEHKRKISESLKGNKRALGHKLSTESKQKMSEKLKGYIPWNKGLVGKHWFNNGINERFCSDCPEGFIKGRLKRKSI